MHEHLDARILIAGEDPRVITVLRKILMREGYRAVETTGDLDRAPDLFRAYRPALTILGFTAPYHLGFTVMARLHELAAGDPLSILVMSPTRERMLHLRALEAGARDFLTTPVDRLEAITKIRNLIEARLLHTAVLDQRRVLAETVALRTSELRDANIELHATRLEIILRLGRLAESHDSDAAGHISRVTHSAAALGEALGLPREACEHLFHASALHDVGKIGVTDRILRKEGRLDPGEMAVMRTHTSIGARVLHGSDQPMMVMAEKIALTHHERWDGLGYPHGLCGREIPLAGRIVAVCDVYDALTSVRSYKSAWSRADAMDEIGKNSGTHFDPEVVRAFERVLPRLTDQRMAG
jgi:putative two-component system response regulator